MSDVNRKIDRLDQYAAFKNLNDNRITQECGLGIGTIGKSRREGRDLSRRSAELILEVYHDLNRTWFLNGEGDMLVSLESAYSSYPLIDIAKAECGRPGGVAEAIKAEGLPRLSIPGVPGDTEFFIQATGYSMINYKNPDLSIPPGALVGLTHIRGDIIRWGEVYAVATSDGIMIKKIVPSPDDSECVVCMSYNSDDYPAFSIRKDEIFDLARLTCVVPIIIR